MSDDPRIAAIPDTHGHAKGEHKTYVEERPLPLTARMLFLWFYHACRRGYPRFLMVADHMNYLTFEDPAAVNLVRRALKLAQAGDLYGAAETANVDVVHAAAVSDGLRRGMRYSIGAEVDNDPRSRPDAQNIVDAMRPDAIIRSVHFLTVTHPVHGENWHWPFDNPEFKDVFDVVGVEQTWELYVTTLVDAIERLPGHIVGHFFVPAVFGHWPDDAKLEEYENRVLDAAAAKGMAIEFNTRFLYREHTDEEKARYLEANKRLLRKARDRGVGIAIGSDAHSPKDQGGAFETVLAVLDELDINEIVFPLAGSLRRVALRIVREPEPEPAAAAEPGAGEEPAAAAPEPVPAAKPVRKARPRPSAARPAESSPERPAERPETAAGHPEGPPSRDHAASPHEAGGAPSGSAPSGSAPNGAPPPSDVSEQGGAANPGAANPGAANRRSATPAPEPPAAAAAAGADGKKTSRPKRPAAKAPSDAAHAEAPAAAAEPAGSPNDAGGSPAVEALAAVAATAVDVLQAAATVAVEPVKAAAAKAAASEIGRASCRERV